MTSCKLTDAVVSPTSKVGRSWSPVANHILTSSPHSTNMPRVPTNTPRVPSRSLRTARTVLPDWCLFPYIFPPQNLLQSWHAFNVFSKISDLFSVFLWIITGVYKKGRSLQHNVFAGTMLVQRTEHLTYKVQDIFAKIKKKHKVQKLKTGLMMAYSQTNNTGGVQKRKIIST